MEAELQAERAAAEAEADRVKAAIEDKRREREQVEAALRTAVRLTRWHTGLLIESASFLYPSRTCCELARRLDEKQPCTQNKSGARGGLCKVLPGNSSTQVLTVLFRRRKPRGGLRRKRLAQQKSACASCSARWPSR